MAEKALKNTSWKVQWNFSIGKRHGVDILFKVVFVYFMYMGDLPTSMSTCIMWVIEEGTGSPGTGVTDTASHYTGIGIQPLTRAPASISLHPEGRYMGPAPQGPITKPPTAYPFSSHRPSYSLSKRLLASILWQYEKRLAYTGKNV